jgi:Mg-chelatase subunit ChlD
MKNEVAKQVALFDDSKRAVANLMARENISVQVVDGAQTASFDPVSRVLTLPAFITMTVDQVDTLTAHEIGHALFSDNSLYEKLAKETNRGSLFTYLNVVEDARIERKMRECFPGLGRVFFNGYQQFFQNGPIFQGNAQGLINPATGATKPFAEFRLIDRINIYFKTGAFCQVPFAADEQVWVNRIAKCSSMDEALEIAKALHKLAKEQDKKDKQNPSNSQEKSKTEKKNEQPQDGEKSDDQNEDEKSSNESGEPQDGETEESDETDADNSTTDEGETTSEPADESDDDENDENAKDSDESESSDESGDESKDGDTDESTDETDGTDGEKSDESTDEESQDSQDSQGGDGAGEGDNDVPEAETDQAATDALKQQAAQTAGQKAQVRNLLISPVSDDVFAQRTVSAKDWSDAAYRNFESTDRNFNATLDLLETSWNEKFMPTVQHMSLEFERRKTARNLQNARVGKTGKLDLRKLAGYKFTEDLFLRSMTVPNGKSHGVVMIVDASGSMEGCFSSVMDQVLLFAHFAFRVNIPFEAYMFTDRSASGYDDGKDYSRQIAQDSTLHQITLADSGIIVGLVNTRTDRGGFKRQVRSCLALRHRYCGDVELGGQIDLSYTLPYGTFGGTPLYTGMMLAEKALGNMKRQNRLDKTTFVVVTDGMDGNGLQYRTQALNQYSGAVSTRMNRVGDTAIVVRDTVTKKNFSYVDTYQSYGGAQVASLPTNAVTTMLLDVIKARHDARTIYLYLDSTTSYSTSFSYRSRYRRRTPSATISIAALGYLTRAFKHEAVAALDTSAVRDALKTDGQYVLPVDLGVADLSIILRTSSLRMDEFAFAKMDASQMTQKTVAKEFTKAMVKATSNRVFVGVVVPFLI